MDPVNPNSPGFDSSALSNNPFVIYDGVLGSKRADKLVFIANHPLTLYGDAAAPATTCCSAGPAPTR